jgi:hypothetical protein
MRETVRTSATMTAMISTIHHLKPAVPAAAEATGDGAGAEIGSAKAELAIVRFTKQLFSTGPARQAAFSNSPMMQMLTSWTKRAHYTSWDAAQQLLRQKDAG